MGRRARIAGVFGAAVGMGLLGLSAGRTGAEAPVAGLRNLHRVSDAVYRSAQPDREQFEALVESCGIRSVLNLRRLHHDVDETRGLGLSLFHVPMRAGHIEEREILRAMRILRACPKPVLVHCWHGSDRTGCVVAVYRMVFQGWDRERAIAEFKSAGLGYHEGWYPNIEAYLRNVDVDHFRSVLESPEPAPAAAPPSAPALRGTRPGASDLQPRGGG